MIPQALTSADAYSWLINVAVIGGVALLVTYFFCIPRYGVLGAGDKIYSTLVSTANDLLHTSPRRTLAMAWLAVKESVRKQAVAGLILFLIVLAFALWFLDPDQIDPSALYITFVLSAVNYLVLLMAVVTSAFSLPADLKNRTIYTIVTKPVRPSEVILGRVLGFAFVCTVPLVIMGVSSYFFVVRSLDHTHTLSESDLREISPQELVIARLPAGSKEGTTSVERGHSHRIIVGPDGAGVTEMGDSSRAINDEAANFLERFGQSHRHRVTAVERNGKRTYEVGPPEGQFHARVPIRGDLTFRGLDGAVNADGMNVGNWTKRGYVAGGTLAAAVYTFHDVEEALFPDGLRVQMDIRLFRTTKQGLNRPVLGSIVLKNPLTGLAAAPRNFAAREYYTLDIVIPRKLTDAAGKQLDVFRDLVHDGTVVLELQCIPRSQFFGVGPEDVYLLAREARFDVNFAKAFVGIWLQMVLTVVMGVMWSTFLSGPVAMLATAVAIVGAVLKPTLVKIAEGDLYGTSTKSGGMLESAVRVVGQKSAMTELDAGATTDAILWIDSVLARAIRRLLDFIPDFSAMSDVGSIARGFDVPPQLLWDHVLQTGAFALPLFLIAFLIFKLIEVAK
ncbi:MAG: hypothetical protein QM775_30365 [Pirellulales bacterium]